MMIYTNAHLYTHKHTSQTNKQKNKQTHKQKLSITNNKKKMKYKSTRGGVEGASFEEVVMSGYASDGGVFVPEILPTFAEEVLSQEWLNLSYQALSVEILSLFSQVCNSQQTSSFPLCPSPTDSFVYQLG